ncbi:MAG: ATP-binding protein [Minicystis sp.]
MHRRSLDVDHVSHDRRIMFGFWSAIVFGLVLAVVSLGAMRAVVRSLSDIAFEDTAALMAVQRLREDVVVMGREARSYLVTGEPARLDAMEAARRALPGQFAETRAALGELEGATVLSRIEGATAGYERALDRVIGMRRSIADPRDVAVVFEVDVQPAREDVNEAFAELATLQERRLHDAKQAAKETISRALVLLVSLSGFALLLSIALGIQLTRSLRSLRERRLAAARHLAEVEALNRELDAFAGRVSHDIRNLLSPIALAAALLPREMDKPDRIRALGDRIQRAIDHALALMNGLLAFSRSSAPQPGAACSVAVVVNESLEQLSPLASQVEATMERRIDDATVCCSRELLNVIVLNVVGNALKFMAGRPRRDLSIAARAEGGACELAVRDTGPGIPEAAIAHIFEPFYRVPGSAQPGTGLGLATVARIIDAHGGQLAVESRLGEGTTFKIRLPLAPRADAGEHVA